MGASMWQDKSGGTDTASVLGNLGLYSQAVQKGFGPSLGGAAPGGAGQGQQQQRPPVNFNVAPQPFIPPPVMQGAPGGMPANPFYGG